MGQYLKKAELAKIHERLYQADKFEKHLRYLYRLTGRKGHIRKDTVAEIVMEALGEVRP